VGGRSSTVEGRVAGEVNCETVFASDCAQIIHKEKVQNSKFCTEYCIMYKFVDIRNQYIGKIARKNKNLKIYCFSNEYLC